MFKIKSSSEFGCQIDAVMLLQPIYPYIDCNNMLYYEAELRSIMLYITSKPILVWAPRKIIQLQP
jgi:hypothetical protein